MDEPRIQFVRWSELKDKLGEILVSALLMRCGGQQVFTPSEIASVTQEYQKTQIVIDMNTCNIMMTLKMRDNDDEPKKI